MPLTMDQVVEEARRWPPEKLAELVDRLTQEIHTAPGVEAAWKDEVRKRVAEIQTGGVEGISGEVVLARIRKIVGR